MNSATMFSDLVMSMLAVNNHPLAKVYPLRAQFQHQGLFDASRVVKMSDEEIITGLIDAGYDRGGVNAVLAPRLRALAEFATQGHLDDLKIKMKGQRDDVDSSLIKLHGVGPAVLRNFWLLQEDVTVST